MKIQLKKKIEYEVDWYFEWKAITVKNTPESDKLN